MNFTEQDNKPQSLVNAQIRVKNLTHDLLKDMTKEQLLDIIADVNSEVFYNLKNTGKANTGNTTVRQFMIEFEANVDLIFEEKAESEQMIKDLIA